MTRRHFQAIAEIVLETRRIAETFGDAISRPDIHKIVNEIVDGLETRLAMFCATENPNFDRDRFERASRGQEGQT